MMILFKIKYFLLLLINIFLITASNNSYASNDQQIINNTKDNIKHNLNGEIFIKKLPESILNIYKKDPMTFYIPGNELFSEPLQLLILQDLIKKTVDVFNEFGVEFWLAENTFLEYLRFNSLAPWAYHASFAIDHNAIKKNIKSITKALKKQGIEFDGFDRINTLKHVPYLKFTTQEFCKIIKKYEPSFSNDELTKKSVQLSYQFIEIDLYPFAIRQSGIYNLIEYLHDAFVQLGGSKNGYYIDDVFPLRQVKLNDIDVNIIKRSHAMLEIKEYLTNVYSVHAGHTICTNSSPLKIKDIRKHYDFLDMIKNFLTFTFKDQFHGMSTTYQEILNK
jgi:hypothetical protein